MIALAEIRLAREIEDGQQRGEVAAQRTGRPKSVPNGNTSTAMYEELGVTRKQVHDWKRTARAGEAVVRKAVLEQVEQGRTRPTSGAPLMP